VYVERNIVARKPNQCPNENAGLPAAYFVPIDVVANNIKILCVVQQCFYGELVNNCTYVFMYTFRYIFQVLNNFGFYCVPDIFFQVLNNFGFYRVPDIFFLV
jgi:hypothetical protein